MPCFLTEILLLIGAIVQRDTRTLFPFSTNPVHCSPHCLLTGGIAQLSQTDLLYCLSNNKGNPEQRNILSFSTWQCKHAFTFYSLLSHTGTIPFCWVTFMIPLLSILFYPFAIPFCRVTIMFSSLPIQSYLFVIPLSFGSHSCSLHFRYSPTYIHLLFLSVGSLYCSLHFQYSPIYIHLLFLSVRSHSCSLHFQYSPISMCYSSLSWVILCSLRFFHSYYHLELFILWGLSCLSVLQVCPSSISW